ncbi:3'(2'),5'-bisphosphate nucleotidase CysQ [Synechococcus sp. M16CYN]|uniref:3'(2'),5'-bisphosphate nucleotidase CysQ family protein n=1 Tax=Synechococcus sp. M16CYN TaxID=3103139 RepID=UPI003251E460
MMPNSVILPAGISQEALLTELRRLSWGAADILRAYARGKQPPHGFPKVLSVDNGGEGPVSAADLAVNQWLIEGLSAAFPDAGWILLSEETAKNQLTEGQPLPAEWLWILDPLDGTKEFLQGTGEYAVHLALVRGNRPVLGVVFLPEADELWIGLVGSGAWCENREGERSPVRFSKRTATSDLLLVTSRSHCDQRLRQLIADLQVGGFKTIGSIGCKVATILRGEADLYISLSNRSAPKDWDVAAPEAVLSAAGGCFTHADLSDLTYNTGDIRQAGCLIASHGKAHAVLGERTTRAMAAIDPSFQV